MARGTGASTPKMGDYILSMCCVSGDEVQVAIHRREDIFRWLRTLDHDGSNWNVVQHHRVAGTIYMTEDITDAIEEEYQHRPL